MGLLPPREELPDYAAGAILALALAVGLLSAVGWL